MQIGRQAGKIIVTTLFLLGATVHIFSLQPQEAFVYLPLIVDFSLAVPFTGLLLESATLGLAGS